MADKTEILNFNEKVDIIVIILSRYGTYCAVQIAARKNPSITPN